LENEQFEGVSQRLPGCLRAGGEERDRRSPGVDVAVTIAIEIYVKRECPTIGRGIS
jgi:hypothetical protein